MKVEEQGRPLLSQVCGQGSLSPRWLLSSPPFSICECYSPLERWNLSFPTLESERFLADLLVKLWGGSDAGNL